LGKRGRGADGSASQFGNILDLGALVCPVAWDQAAKFISSQNFDGTFGNETAAAIAAFQKANRLTETGALNSDLVKKVYAAAGKPEPPEGHIFVRQGFNRVFDAPIALRQPSQPLGTNLYTALNFAPGDSKTRWVAFSLEGGDPATALDRLEIPDEVRQKISENLTPGSSLIVAETSVDSAILPDGDDFLVWAKEPSSKTEPPHVKQANVEQRDVARANPKRATHAHGGAISRESWSRAVKSYSRDRFPRFDGFSVVFSLVRDPRGEPQTRGIIGGGVSPDIRY
jgi:peptidoglycan hydrolase-like protein with peptidoglycan-binding domain